MIGELLFGLFYGLLTVCPVLALPVGFVKGLGFLTEVVGFINIFVPLVRLAPVVSFIVLIRNWNILVAVLRFVLRFIPFMDGG